MAMQHFIYSKECILLRKQSTKFIDVSEREQKYQSFLTKKTLSSSIIIHGIHYAFLKIIFQERQNL